MMSDEARPADRNAAPRRLLVPIDGSPEDGPALRLAVGLARGLAARLTLLAIAPRREPPVPMTAVTAYGAATAYGALTIPGEEQDDFERRAWAQVDAAADELPSGLEVGKTVVVGAPGEAIVEEVADGGHDLVILPWHGHGTLGHLLHDHTVRHVLDHCAVPVIAVPTPA